MEQVSRTPASDVAQVVLMTCWLLQVGLGVAVGEMVEELGIDLVWERIQHLAHVVRRGLRELQGVTVQDHGRQLCGLVSFTVAGLTGGLDCLCGCGACPGAHGLMYFVPVPCLLSPGQPSLCPSICS